MDSDITGNILGKIEAKAGLIGGALGFMNCPIANAGGINANVLTVIQDRLSKITHIPDPAKILEMEFSLPAEFPIWSYAMGAIGGWALQQVGPMVDSRLGQLGRVLKKLLLNALIGNIASGFIWLAPYNPGGPGGYSTSGMGTSNLARTSPQWSGAPGGPGAPHATANDGYRDTMTFERVVA